MTGELKDNWRKRQLRTPQLDRRRIFELQVSLHAVKTCSSCGTTRPVEMFDMGEQGISDDCEVCRHERQAGVFKTRMRQGWEKAKPRVLARRRAAKTRRIRENWP